jgi:beta-lactamase superfamily II metal-dependent hydrolase
MREVNGNLTASHQVVYAAASLDQSVPNLSSLVFLLEHNGRRILFTGDARGDRIVAGLEELNLLTDGILEVDVLKVPHHGSERSCTGDLFETVRADHYFVSGNGTNGNPSVAMADRLCHRAEVRRSRCG